jgi:hypothetical protein
MVRHHQNVRRAFGLFVGSHQLEVLTRRGHVHHKLIRRVHYETPYRRLRPLYPPFVLSRRTTGLQQRCAHSVREAVQEALQELFASLFLPFLLGVFFALRGFGDFCCYIPRELGVIPGCAAIWGGAVAALVF